MRFIRIWMLASSIHLCIFVLHHFTFVDSVPIFHNGTYKNIVVAFHDDITVDSELIEKLMKLIQAASDELYVATRGLAFIGEVIIVGRFPVGNYSNITAGRHHFSNADIRIDKPRREFGDNPYTLQTGECARLLVHEWAHFRYGVFDEHLTLLDDPSISFKWESSEILPMTCNYGIQGWALTENLQKCAIDCERVDSDCRFYPDMKSNEGIEASLMSYPYLPDVKYFCNKSDHDWRLPFLQNRICNYRSIMDVILAHEDFKDGHPKLLEKPEQPPMATTLVWRYVRKDTLRFIFLVESSKIVEEQNWMLQQFVARFFKDHAPNGFLAALVKFSNVTQEMKGFVGRDGNFAEKMLTPMSKFRYASPNIGNAIQKSYELLSGWNEGGATIILISTGDGEIEEDQYRLLQGSDMVIHTIAVGRKPSWRLDDLSRMTGGNSYFLGSHRSLDLDMAFLASMQSVVKADVQPVVISYERLKITAKDTTIHYFHVEEHVGKDLVVTVAARNLTHISASLTDPTNTTHMNKKIGLRHYFEDAMSGRWKLALRYSGMLVEPLYVDIMVTAKPRDPKNPPIRVHSWITNATDKNVGKIKHYHRIYAEVKKGYEAVVNATVVATVEILDRAEPIKVVLRDNGATPDVFKNDGIYSNFLPMTERPAGRPVVIVRVSNEDGKARLKLGTNQSETASGMLKDEDYERLREKFGRPTSRFGLYQFSFEYACMEPRMPKKDKVEYAPLPFFNRSAMANSPVLSEVNEIEAKQTPPTAIRDLIVVTEYEKEDEYYAVLRWTSPEHPELDSEVSSIEIRGSVNPDIVRTEAFITANVIAEVKDVLPAGEMQQMEVKIPRDLVAPPPLLFILVPVRNFYLIMRARDKEENFGDISFFAVAFWERVMDLGQRDKSDPSKEKDEKTWIPWAIAVFCLLLGIALLSILAYWKWETLRKRFHLPRR